MASGRVGVDAGLSPQVQMTTYEKAINVIKEMGKDIWLKVRRCCPNPRAALLSLADYSQVNILGLRYKSINFAAEKSPDSRHAVR